MVIVTLNDSRVHAGRIDSITEDSFLLIENEQEETFHYTDVATISLKNPEYKSRRTVDPVRVRQIVYDIGIGNTAKLKQISGTKITGDILSIEKDAFTISDSRTSAHTYVAFKDVVEIEKIRNSMSIKKQFAGVGIALGTIAGILLVIGLIYYSSHR